jgi:hypothetical protein
MDKLYQIEPRDNNKELNVKYNHKMDWLNFDPDWFISWWTENQVFDIYFKYNQNKENANWVEVWDFFKSKWLSIRVKHTGKYMN